MFNDKNFDPDDGVLAFDLANRDGILGDKFLVTERSSRSSRLSGDGIVSVG